MITSKITTKAQTTIPQTVREVLGVGPGDALAYRIEGNRVTLERAPQDVGELESLTSLLNEWSSPENDIYDQL